MHSWMCTAADAIRLSIEKRMRPRVMPISGTCGSNV